MIKHTHQCTIRFGAKSTTISPVSVADLRYLPQVQTPILMGSVELPSALPSTSATCSVCCCSTSVPTHTEQFTRSVTAELDPIIHWLAPCRRLRGSPEHSPGANEEGNPNESMYWLVPLASRGFGSVLAARNAAGRRVSLARTALVIASTRSGSSVLEGHLGNGWLL